MGSETISRKPGREKRLGTRKRLRGSDVADASTRCRRLCNCYGGSKICTCIRASSGEGCGREVCCQR